MAASEHSSSQNPGLANWPLSEKCYFRLGSVAPVKCSRKQTLKKGFAGPIAGKFSTAANIEALTINAIEPNLRGSRASSPYPNDFSSLTTPLA